MARLVRAGVAVDRVGAGAGGGCAATGGDPFAAGRPYKFCLAFDRDRDAEGAERRMSERLAAAWAAGCVPVYGGGFNAKGVAPGPRALIDIRDFASSPEALAKHLLHLDRNRTAYLEFFAWKKKGVVSEAFLRFTAGRACAAGPPGDSADACRPCRRARNATHTEGPVFKAHTPEDPPIGWHPWCGKHMKPRKDLSKFVDKHNIKQILAKDFPGMPFAKEYWAVRNASHIAQASVRALPTTFIMKANHMSGGVVLVRDGQGKCLKKCAGTRYSSSEPTWQYLRRACAKMLRKTYGVDKGEMFYANIPKKCIFEEYLTLEDMYDYKIWVFHGRVMFVHIDSGRFTEHLRNFRTPVSWREIPMRDGGTYAFKKNDELQDVPPPFLPEMLASAQALAKGIPWVRVDFLVYRDRHGTQRYMFGEMTFAHDSCKKKPRKSQSNFVPEVAEHFYGYVAAHPKHAVDPDLILDVIELEGEMMKRLGAE